MISITYGSFLKRRCYVREESDGISGARAERVKSHLPSLLESGYSVGMPAVADLLPGIVIILVIVSTDYVRAAGERPLLDRPRLHRPVGGQ